MKPNVEEGSIIQLADSSRWPDCLAVVTEVRSWGVLAYIQLPGSCEGITYVVNTLRAHLRLGWNDFVATGGKVAPRNPELEMTP